MFRRRHTVSLEYDPLVIDRHGQVIGVRTPPPPPPAESRESRLWDRRRNLALTGETHLQAAVRNQCAVFHVDAPDP